MRELPHTCSNCKDPITKFFLHAFLETNSIIAVVQCGTCGRAYSVSGEPRDIEKAAIHEHFINPLYKLRQQ